MLYDLITQEDKNKILNYINDYAGESMIGDINSIDLPNVLRYWSMNKLPLYNLLGSQFIYKKDVEVKRHIDETSSRMAGNKLIDEYFQKLAKGFREHIFDLYSWEPSDISRDEFRIAERYYYSLFNYMNLATNRWSGPTEPLVICGKTYLRAQKNMKHMKLLKTVAEIAGIDDEFEEFRLAHSMILNDNIVKGKLCLSIHPLDFMTMSDTNTWSSCMSWRERGCYRSGTVEMMNSPLVLVAYLESGSQNISFCEQGSSELLTWNHKKWRSLFIVDKNFITSVKSYPYHSDDISLLTAQTIAELANKNWGSHFEDDSMFIRENEYLNSLTFRSYGNMYCDMGTAEAYAGGVSADFDITAIHTYDKYDQTVNYSGELNCMVCGEDLDDNDCSDEGNITCECCDPNHCYCCGCDRAMNENSDEIIWINGDPYCEDCVYDYFVLDPWSDDYVSKDDLLSVEVSLSNNKIRQLLDCPEIDEDTKTLIQHSFRTENSGYTDEFSINPDFLSKWNSSLSQYIRIDPETFLNKYIQDESLSLDLFAKDFALVFGPGRWNWNHIFDEYTEAYILACNTFFENHHRFIEDY